MPKPTFTTSKLVTTHVHEIITRTPDYIDYLTIFLPVIIPVLTFFLGYKLNEWVEERKEKKRLKDVKEYFLTLAEYLASILDTQAESIRNTIVKVEAMADDAITSMVYVELNTSRIKSMPYLDQYKIFVAGKSNITEATAHLNHTSGALDFVDAMIDRIQKVNGEISGQRKSYDKSYTENAYAISEINTKFSIENKSPSDDEEGAFFELNDIYAQCAIEYGNKVISGVLKKTDLTSRYDQLIKPLYDKTRGIPENSKTHFFLERVGSQYFNYQEFLRAKASTIQQFNELLIDCDLIATTMREIRQKI